jgi:hypothetical protein
MMNQVMTGDARHPNAVVSCQSVHPRKLRNYRQTSTNTRPAYEHTGASHPSSWDAVLAHTCWFGSWESSCGKRERVSGKHATFFSSYAV